MHATKMQHVTQHACFSGNARGSPLSRTNSSTEKNDSLANCTHIKQSQQVRDDGKKWSFQRYFHTLEPFEVKVETVERMSKCFPSKQSRAISRNDASANFRNCCRTQSFLALDIPSLARRGRLAPSNKLPCSKFPTALGLLLQTCSKISRKQ